MKELIRVYEHQSLKVNSGNGFTDKHLDLLSKFLGNKGGDTFPYYSLIHHGVKFKSYVGVISVGDLQIEVLPKADKVKLTGDSEDDDEKNAWEDYLLEMLRVVHKLKVHSHPKADQRLKQNRVLDVLLNQFMDEVERIMHVGLVKAYRRVEDNRTSLKGRLVMCKHIIKNIVHQERFFVEYTTYDRNHIFNRLLYKALRVIQDIAASNEVILRAKRLEFEFPELEDIVPTESLFNRIDFDRKTEDYRSAVALAKLVLLNYMPNMTYQRGNSVVALMFNMNDLWEEYVYVTLKHNLPGYIVSAQKRKDFWHSNVGGKIIKPDIVIKKDGRCVAVLDTKWKCPLDGKPSDSDLKQMYVYHKYWDTDRTALLYPASSDRENVVGHFVSEIGDTAECDMFYLTIKSEKGPHFLEIESLMNYISIGEETC